MSEARHATSVAIDGAGVMLEGPSGSGKSALALELIALGARLVADDRTRIECRPDGPWVIAPERLAGVIEARGLGLLSVDHVAEAPLRLIVDLAERETARLPEPCHETLCGFPVRRLRGLDAGHFPSAIVAAARGGFWGDG